MRPELLSRGQLAEIERDNRICEVSGVLSHEVENAAIGLKLLQNRRHDQEKIGLTDVFPDSEKRGYEVATRLRSTWSAFQRQGYKSWLITITDDNRCVGDTPKDSRTTLRGKLNGITRKITRSGMRYACFWVVEAHEDGMPHLHVVIFTPSKFNAMSLQYERSVVVQPIQKPDYVLKTVAPRYERGKVSILLSRLWCYVWGIRQYGFQGLPPLRLFRALEKPLNDANLSRYYTATLFPIAWPLYAISRPIERWRFRYMRLPSEPPLVIHYA